MLVSTIKGRSCHAGRRSAGWPRAQSHSRPCIARSHTGAVLRRSGGRPPSPAGHQPEGDRGHLHRPRVSRGPSRRAARAPRGRSPGLYPRPRPWNRKDQINGFLNEEPREALDGTPSIGPPTEEERPTEDGAHIRNTAETLPPRQV